MNCPKRGCQVEKHRDDGCYGARITLRPHGLDEDDLCGCRLTEAHALRAAQRHAAAVVIRRMSLNANLAIHYNGFTMALRELGILQNGETEQDLLDEFAL